MSIGAGNPKLSVWETISAGGNQTPVSGKSWCTRVRIASTNLLVGSCFSCSETRMSQSEELMVPVVLYDKLQVPNTTGELCDEPSQPATASTSIPNAQRIVFCIKLGPVKDLPQ